MFLILSSAKNVHFQPTEVLKSEWLCNSEYSHLLRVNFFVPFRSTKRDNCCVLYALMRDNFLSTCWTSVLSRPVGRLRFYATFFFSYLSNIKKNNPFVIQIRLFKSRVATVSFRRTQRLLKYLCWTRKISDKLIRFWVCALICLLKVGAVD